MTQVVTDRFGACGGRYVSETLVPARDALELEFELAPAVWLKREDLNHTGLGLEAKP